MKTRPNIVTIAGFDPSNGAGLSADIKTFETLKCYGFAVQTANTVQNDITFESCHWIPLEIMIAQIDVLFKRFAIDYVKIGIVENWTVLSSLVDKLLEINPKVKIILDPVLKASSNFNFHENGDQRKMAQQLDEVLSKIYLLTPNYDEIAQLYPEKDNEETIKHIASKTNLLLKGGHNTTAIGKDQLFTITGKQFILNPKFQNCSEKHGSGCVLASAITSYLALGFPLLKACYKGKRYTEKFLSSNKTLLGTHSKK